MKTVRPKAREEGIVVRELLEEVLIYDLESHKAVCLNRTAAHVWRSCDGRRSVPAIARTLSAQLGEAVPEEVVWLALDQLGRDKLLDTRVRRPAELADMTRRDLIRRISLTAAVVALPLVTSIIAPTAQAANSCFPTGHACNEGIQCCNGACSGAPNGTCV